MEIWRKGQGRFIAAGALGGAIGATLSFVLAYQTEIAWIVVDGLGATEPRYSNPSPLSGFFSRLITGVIVGSLVGSLGKDYPRLAAWMGLMVGFAVTLICFFPQQRIRE
jgi:hypothetical protein